MWLEPSWGGILSQVTHVPNYLSERNDSRYPLKCQTKIKVKLQIVFIILSCTLFFLLGSLYLCPIWFAWKCNCCCWKLKKIERDSGKGSIPKKRKQQQYIQCISYWIFNEYSGKNGQKTIQNKLKQEAYSERDLDIPPALSRQPGHCGRVIAPAPGWISYECHSPVPW